MTINLFGMKLTDKEIDRLRIFLFLLIFLGVIALFRLARYVVPSAAPSGSIKDYWMPTEAVVILGLAIIFVLLVNFHKKEEKK